MIPTRSKMQIRNGKRSALFVLAAVTVLVWNLALWWSTLRPTEGLVFQRCADGDGNGTSRCERHVNATTTTQWAPKRLVAFYDGADAVVSLEEIVVASSPGREVYESERARKRRQNPPPSNDEAVSPPKKVIYVPPSPRIPKDNVANASVATVPVIADADATASAKEETKCVPVATWQTQSHPNCNTMHESNMENDIESHLNLGEYRDVWKVNMGDASFALKTLRVNNEKLFSPQRAEQHRLDAAASERLSGSPYVANIYGFCGQSVVNGLGEASGHLLRRQDKLSSRRKLKFALDAARGVAAAHGIDANLLGGDGASLIHRDVRGPNFLVSPDGKSMMLHDFNCARIVPWDPTTGRTCAFKKQECNNYRSPEECMGKPLTEKIDVYSLGNVFYAIVTGHAPYEYPRKVTSSVFKSLIINGTTPTLPEKVARSTDVAVVAILRAMERCHTYDPTDRPSAREIVDDLQTVFQSLPRRRERRW